MNLLIIDSGQGTVVGMPLKLGGDENFFPLPAGPEHEVPSLHPLR